jgi:hypothetical protein
MLFLVQTPMMPQFNFAILKLKQIKKFILKILKEKTKKKQQISM